MLPEGKKRKKSHENGSDADFFLFAVSICAWKTMI